MLHEWQLSNPTEFGKSKKRILDANKRGKESTCKHQKKQNENENYNLKVHDQSTADKVINEHLK